MLRVAPTPMPPTRDVPRVPGVRAHPKAARLAWGEAGSCPASGAGEGREAAEEGGGSGLIRAGMLPQQEAGAPAGLAPRQRRGGQRETANKEQNLPF